MVVINEVDEAPGSSPPPIGIARSERIQPVENFLGFETAARQCSSGRARHPMDDIGLPHRGHHTAAEDDRLTPILTSVKLGGVGDV